MGKLAETTCIQFIHRYEGERAGKLERRKKLVELLA